MLRPKGNKNAQITPIRTTINNKGALLVMPYNTISKAHNPTSTFSNRANLVAIIHVTRAINTRQLR